MPLRFPWVPDFGAQATRQPRVRSVQFGDGYRQDQEDGLNADLPSWEVQFSARSKAEADAIDGFLTARRGVERFLFKRPDSDFTVTGMGFGVGDGSTTAFQLQRTRVTTTMDALGSYPNPTTPRTNLLTYSQDFANAAWPKVGCSTPTTYTAPDGSITAMALTEDTSTGAHALNRSGATVGSLQTFSIYAKAGGRSQIALQLGSATAYFNLATGAVISGSGASITLVGNGWYRCSITGTPTNTNSIVYLASGGSASYAGTGLSAYLWGAQMEAGSVATRYIPTTTAAVTVTPAYYPAAGDGFEPVTEPGPDLAIYVQDWQGNQRLYPWARTNKLTYSEQLNQWGMAAASCAGANINITTAPDGNYTADKLMEDSTTAAHFTAQTLTSVGTGPVTISCWARPAGRSWCYLRLNDGSDHWAWFNVLAGTVGTTSSGVTAAITPGPSGWFRISLTYTSASASPTMVMGTATADNVSSFTGDGTSGICYWGIQGEEGSTPTAYIPTTTAAVTRTDYTLGASGAVTFSVAPALNAILTWSGSGADWRLVTCKRWSPVIGQTWRISATFQVEAA